MKRNDDTMGNGITLGGDVIAPAARGVDTIIAPALGGEIIAPSYSSSFSNTRLREVAG